MPEEREHATRQDIQNAENAKRHNHVCGTSLMGKHCKKHEHPHRSDKRQHGAHIAKDHTDLPQRN